MASLGRSIKPPLPGGAQIIGSGNLEGASMPYAANAVDAKSGLVPRYCRKRRRLAARMIDGVIEGSSPADVIFYCEQDSSAGDYPVGFRQKSDTQPCANRLAP